MLAALVVGEVEQRPPVKMQHVEDDVGGRHPPGSPGSLGSVGQVQPLLQEAEAGPSVGAERDKLTVEDRRPRAELLPRLAQLGKGAVDVLIFPAHSPGAPAADVDDGPHSVPLDLIGPAVVAARQRSGDGEHGLDPLGQRLETCPGGIHPVDHPVLPASREEHIAALRPRPVQDDLDLALGPLLQLVLAVIPDGDEPAAVLAFADIALEAAVLQRVILGMDGKMVRCRVLGNSLWQCPGDQDAVMLKPEIPVQRPRMVLLDDERRRGLALLPARARCPHRLRGPGGIALCPVSGQRGVVTGGRLAGTAASRRRHLPPIPETAAPYASIERSLRMKRPKCGSNIAGLADSISSAVHHRPPLNSAGSSVMGSCGLPEMTYHKLTSVWPRSSPVARVTVMNTGWSPAMEKSASMSSSSLVSRRAEPSCMAHSYSRVPTFPRMPESGGCETNL